MIKIETKYALSPSVLRNHTRTFQHYIPRPKHHSGESKQVTTVNLLVLVFYSKYERTQHTMSYLQSLETDVMALTPGAFRLKWEVFLSIRGSDTRNTIMKGLYESYRGAWGSHVTGRCGIGAWGRDKAGDDGSH